MQERRHDYRWDLVVPCQCQWEDVVINTQTSDVSFGGASLSHPMLAPPEGAEIGVTLYAEGDIFLRGRVIYTSPRTQSANGRAHFGVKFHGTVGERSRRLMQVLTLHWLDQHYSAVGVA